MLNKTFKNDKLLMSEPHCETKPHNPPEDGVPLFRHLTAAVLKTPPPVTVLSHKNLVKYPACTSPGNVSHGNDLEIHIRRCALSRLTTRSIYVYMYTVSREESVSGYKGSCQFGSWEVLGISGRSGFTWREDPRWCVLAFQIPGILTCVPWMSLASSPLILPVIWQWEGRRGI